MYGRHQLQLSDSDCSESAFDVKCKRYSFASTRLLMATVRTVTAKRGEMDVDVLLKGGKPLGHARRITSYTGISLPISTPRRPAVADPAFSSRFLG